MATAPNAIANASQMTGDGPFSGFAGTWSALACGPVEVSAGAGVVPAGPAAFCVCVSTVVRSAGFGVVEPAAEKAPGDAWAAGGAGASAGWLDAAAPD
jgi:hypothetical protein